MAPLPMHKRSAINGREAVWAAVRRLKRFTIRQLREETRMHITSVREYCRGLAAAGYICPEAEPPAGGTIATRPAVVWLLQRDCGVDAPRVREDGTQVTQGCKRTQMWRTMKVLGTFTPLSLAIGASLEQSVVSETDAKDYISNLCRAGYIASQRGGGYRFLRRQNSGPKAPMVQRGKQAVWDPNRKCQIDLKENAHGR